jgi:hypothetical protein
MQIGTAILHLGCVRFPITGPVAYTMSATDAVELGRLIQPTTTFPVHFEGWTHFHQGRADLERKLVETSTNTLGHVVWPTSGHPHHIDT